MKPRRMATVPTPDAPPVKTTTLGDATLDTHTFEMAQVPIGDLAEGIMDDGPQGAATKIYEATSFIRKAVADLQKLQALYKPDDSAYGQCETIDDHLFEALRLLGD